VSTKLRGTYAEINLEALRANLRSLKSLLSSSNWICPMVKANAYGHGDVPVSLALQEEGVDALGVVLVEEGIHLRNHGVKGKILVFGVFDFYSAQECVNFQLTPVLSTWNQVKAFEETLSEQQKYSVHIKFNTGMNRLGFDVSEAGALKTYFQKTEKFLLSGICTHLALAEDWGSGGNTEQQLAIFESTEKLFQENSLESHVLNSAAILLQRGSQYGARPGIALYGANPMPHRTLEITLDPVMSMKSHIEIVRPIKKGERVSYGGTWVAEKDTVIGVVPIGYGDGLPRQASNKASMLLGSVRVPVCGTICMDYTMVDLSSVAQKEKNLVGKELLVFGRSKLGQVRAEEWAEQAGTISYEITTKVSSRVPRIYYGERGT